MSRRVAAWLLLISSATAIAQDAAELPITTVSDVCTLTGTLRLTSLPNGGLLLRIALATPEGTDRIELEGPLELNRPDASMATMRRDPKAPRPDVLLTLDRWPAHEGVLWHEGREIWFRSVPRPQERTPGTWASRAPTSAAFPARSSRSASRAAWRASPPSWR